MLLWSTCLWTTWRGLNQYPWSSSWVGSKCSWCWDDGCCTVTDKSSASGAHCSKICWTDVVRCHVWSSHVKISFPWSVTQISKLHQHQCLQFQIIVHYHYPMQNLDFAVLLVSLFVCPWFTIILNIWCHLSCFDFCGSRRWNLFIWASHPYLSWSLG